MFKRRDGGRCCGPCSPARISIPSLGQESVASTAGHLVSQLEMTTKTPLHRCVHAAAGRSGGSQSMARWPRLASPLITAGPREYGVILRSHCCIHIMPKSWREAEESWCLKEHVFFSSVCCFLHCAARVVMCVETFRRLVPSTGHRSASAIRIGSPRGAEVVAVRTSLDLVSDVVCQRLRFTPSEPHCGKNGEGGESEDLLLNHLPKGQVSTRSQADRPSKY